MPAEVIADGFDRHEGAGRKPHLDLIARRMPGTSGWESSGA